MNLISNISPSLVQIDRALQIDFKKSADQVGSQSSIIPATVALPEAGVPVRSGGLLSSTNIAEVLNLTDKATATAASSKTPQESHEAIDGAISRSKSLYTPGDSSWTSNPPSDSRYTQSDVGLIGATTGFKLGSGPIKLLA